MKMNHGAITSDLYSFKCNAIKSQLPVFNHELETEMLIAFRQNERVRREMMSDPNVMAAAVTIFIAGGLMGAMGQGIRVLVGMKKIRDQEVAGSTVELSFNRLVSSIFMGFVAGSLAALVITDESLQLTITKETMMGFLAAGYAGTDFIEGFASRILTKKAS